MKPKRSESETGSELAPARFADPNPVPAPEQANVSLIYQIVLRRPSNRRRVVIWLERGVHKSQLGHYKDGVLVFLSSKPRDFFDEEDEENISLAAEQLLEGKELSTNVGSVELLLYLKKGPVTEVRFVGESLFARWTPHDGLQFEKDAHPAFRKDCDHIARACLELPQGLGGIFNTGEAG